MAEVLDVDVVRLVERAEKLDAAALRALAEILFGPGWWTTPNPDLADEQGRERAPFAAAETQDGRELIRDRIWTVLFSGIS